MGTLGSVQDLEKIIEAANALLSAERTLPKPKKAFVATEVAPPDDQGSAAVPDISKKGPRSDPTSESIAGHNPGLRSKVPYFFLHLRYGSSRC